MVVVIISETILCCFQLLISLNRIDEPDFGIARVLVLTGLRGMKAWGSQRVVWEEMLFVRESVCVFVSAFESKFERERERECE